MRFSYHPKAGEIELIIEGELYRHLYLSRRTPMQKILAFRNLKDDRLYFYEQKEVCKKYARLCQVESRYSPQTPLHKTHLLWAIIALKSVEKTLPYLNQMGVCKISFFYAEYSQKNEKPNHHLEKFQKILIQSSQQCGRSDLMVLEFLENTEQALKTYPKAAVMDLHGTHSSACLQDLQQGVMIGPEGGFSPKERELFDLREIYKISNPFTLTSEGMAILCAGIGSQKI
ncbi:16S rRNA (uracil(1498)-N(3))-methyltransferase [Helicobacter cynogastricus]|uniref:16S rRNA (uracil(1498)-N(3))-methyltransferase n=1 Tax=Helicobacter cynogastricus TaxID=329937 RepID=UPI000CF1072B|nr:16S rRNA (uracil(1498)-N(3))-methyltransferase [Helicobacter cynogastricus]